MEALKPADNAPIKHIWEKMHRGSRYMGAAKPGNARQKMYFALKKIIDELRDCLKIKNCTGATKKEACWIRGLQASCSHISNKCIIAQNTEQYNTNGRKYGNKRGIGTIL